ncbi:sex determination protein fruitless [Drosophila ficusphila]|uniref:sex determination protein fruitless n=1 Tax=Drosophila ficusphila TaxID=30025 RepID=UPI0007E7F203|nr:sex determination protein fruitless [Drosophila ficusphila]
MGGPTAPVASSGEVGQTYCLRWNNHQTNLVQILHALHEVGSYVDCSLVVDDEQFQAHRVVLAANSPYFQHILKDVPQDHCSIILPGVKGFEIAALLQYMYTGETTVTKSQEPEILRTAKELQVKGLYDNLMKFNHASATPTSSSSSAGQGKPQNGSSSNHSSSVISTSTHISPSAAISSSCSPPPPPQFGYQPGFGHYPQQQQQPHLPGGPMPAGDAPLTPTQATPHSGAPGAGESGGQWPLTPSAAAAMLNSVYESAADMNPLKRKKLSAISSMLLSGNRDTPILRNVLAQANPADSSQPGPTMITNGEKTPTHPHQSSQLPAGLGVSGGGGSVGGERNHSFNGSDYGGDKEPLSPYTDRSFEEETGQSGGKKPEWKRYKQYTRADMMCAIQAVREGMSALQASRKYGLPSRTLYDKVRKLNITTGRGTHRTPKRSPPGAESSQGFPYSAAAAAAAHNYGGHGHGHGHHSEVKRDGKTDHVPAHHGMPPTIPPSAAALLDHAFLQQALENRGGDMAGREALHAMALAAAAHAAANRLSASPAETDQRSNGHGMRSPSPQGRHYSHDQEAMDLEMEKHEQRMIKRERDQDEREDADDEEDQEQEHVEDLSLARKERPHSPYSPQPGGGDSAGGVIMHASSAPPPNGKDHEEYPGSPPFVPMGLKRELLESEEAQARAD